MSLNKSTTRRLSLLAGSSLVAASLTAFTFTPGTAFAANECGDPTANAAAADVFACTGSQGAITYATQGALTLTLTNGVAVTTGGLSVTATGADTVLINRSDATVGGGDPVITSTAGAGIAVTAATGAVTLTLSDGDTGDTPIAITGATRGVSLATASTTAAALTLTTTNGSITATGAGGIGVEATSNSLAAGNLLLTLGGSVSGATGVKATSSGTGTLTVTLTAASATVSGGDIVGTAGPAIRLTPAANGTVTVNAGRTVRASNPGGGVIEFTTVNATRTVTVTNNGANTGRGVIRPEDATPAGYGQIAILVGGGAGNVTISNSRSILAASEVGLIQGRLSFLNTGTVGITNRGIWHSTGVNTLGAGTSAGTLTNGATNDPQPAILATNYGGAASSLVFGDGADTFTNRGTLAVGDSAEGAATLEITGLETWSNAGYVLFGSNDLLDLTDHIANDRIAAQGVAYSGSSWGAVGFGGFSHLSMDVDFRGDQADCSAAVYADCLDLRGGSTVTGLSVTEVVVNLAAPGDASRIVLIDVAGAGASDGAHFTLSPDSENYQAIGGGAGVVDGGLFLYGLSYDPAAKQHVLTPATLDREGLELGLVGREANVAWATATGAWFTRQADLRTSLAGRDGGLGGGGWLKIAGNFVEDTIHQSYVFGPDTTEFNNGYAQRTTALIGGFDIIGGASEGRAWVLGVTGGQLKSDLDFHRSDTEVEFEGNSLGAYASFVGPTFYVDAIVNSVSLDTTYMAPTANLTGEGQVDSLGYQAEAGYHLPTDGFAYIEPLVALTYVKSELGDLAMANAVARYDETTLFRGALGVRMAGDIAMDKLTTKFAFTGRIWQEFEGVNTAAVVTGGPSFDLIDDTAGMLGDVGATLSAYSPDGRFSANLAYSVKFNDDEYQSTDVSMSFRYTW